MSSLQELQRNWEGFARTDPLWSICADPAKRNQLWNREEFFASGEKELATVLNHATKLGLEIQQSAPALDFGCGVGRLTRALAGRFSECWGLDISSTMIRLAQEFNHDIPNCHFVVNESERLEKLESCYFGFIYSSIVLQHIANEYAHKYIAELIRTLRPQGIFIFQVPEKFQGGWVKQLRAKLALRSRIGSLLGNKPFLMEMHCIKEQKILDLVQQHGAKVVDVQLTNSCDPAFSGNLQYLEQAPAGDYVSKQYCVIKK